MRMITRERERESSSIFYPGVVIYWGWLSRVNLIPLYMTTGNLFPHYRAGLSAEILGKMYLRIAAFIL